MTWQHFLVLCFAAIGIGATFMAALCLLAYGLIVWRLR